MKQIVKLLNEIKYVTHTRSRGGILLKICLLLCTRLINNVHKVNITEMALSVRILVTYSVYICKKHFFFIIDA